MILKKFVSIICCIFSLVLMILPAYAVEASSAEVIYYEETVLEDGLRIVDQIVVESNARAVNKTATRTRTFYSGDTLIAQIAFQGTFYYDGSIVRVVSKTVTQTDTYEGWSYKQSSFTSSGGTITLEGKLTKLLVLNQAVEMSLSCDANGNITKG